MTQVEVADGFGGAGQTNGVAEDVVLDGMLNPVMALEFHATMLPRRGPGFEWLTCRFDGCDHRLTHAKDKIVKAFPV